MDAGEVFAMLVEQQLQSVPGSRELRREFGAGAEGAGAKGLLATQVPQDVGLIDSVSRSQIMTAERHTLIAQLTVPHYTIHR